jgi:hypothetical protein
MEYPTRDGAYLGASLTAGGHGLGSHDSGLGGNSVHGGIEGWEEEEVG